MAATYVPNFELPRDRVRLMVSDKAAPWSFQDEEIYYALTDAGYDGDPQAEGPKQARSELVAAIALVESLPLPSAIGDQTTIKTLTTSRINVSTVKNRSALLVNLKRHLALFDSAASGIAGGPAVADGYPSCACETVRI